MIRPFERHFGRPFEEIDPGMRYPQEESHGSGHARYAKVGGSRFSDVAYPPLAGQAIGGRYLRAALLLRPVSGVAERAESLRRRNSLERHLEPEASGGIGSALAARVQLVRTLAVGVSVLDFARDEER